MQQAIPHASWVEPFRRFSTANWIVAGTALFIILNAMSVCIGWWMRIPALVQVFPNTPTQFNTAFLFILLGVGEFGLVLRRRGVVVAVAVVVTCVVSAQLAEYALHINLGIDTVFAVPFLGSDAPHPGRMSGNTGACFLLVCTAQVIMSKPDREAGLATTAVVILKSLAGGIAFIALIGYLVGLRSAYGWTGSVGMSIHSCAGFLLIFIARIAALWQRDIVDKPSLPNWFLPFLTIAVVAISIDLIWLFSSPLVRPFMLDPLYSPFAHRVSIGTALSVGTLIFLGTISVLVARHKAVMARVSEKKLSSVLEHMSEGVMLMDAKGKISYENPASLRIHGLAPDGATFIKNQDAPVSWECWTEQGRPLDLSEWPLSRVARGERVQNQVLRARCCEIDHEFFASYNGSAIYDDNGKIVLSFITIQDITERRNTEKELRESEHSLRVTQARLESTLEASSVGTWTWHIGSNLLIGDEFTARMFSLEKDAAAQGLPVAAYLRVVHQEDRPEVAAALGRAIQLCASYDIEYRVRQDDSAFRWLHARGRVESDDTGEAAYFHGAVMDITDRKIAELSLREKNRHLARSNRDLEDFAYVASHDLKSPLSGIDNAAKWLEEDLQHTLSDESRKILALMRSRINRMEKLLDDLLTYSRAGRTDTAVVETNVAAIFCRIIEILGPPPHIHVRAEGELPVLVTASAQLEHVLRNLINNAIKHHDKPHGEVVLSGHRVGDYVEFVVRDDGPGILPQFHDKIFQLFQTLKRRDEVEGSGMGLALVKKLVEQQNSRITVHSQGNGTGTEFRFRWPTVPLTYDIEEMAHA
jgi:signal transduction histidine kinase